MNEARSHELVHRSLDAVGEICARHQIAALEDFLRICRSFAKEECLNVAVLGRFKAGKSTLLNHLLGISLLPVGVVPVTTVVTEIRQGPRERAEVHFLDGHVQDVPIGQIAEFITEAQNPDNKKAAKLLRIELPCMERYRGLHFVDTPGLESVMEHNTNTSMAWLPHIGLALVAVGVNSPLSQHDVELMRNLSRYTPNVSLVLTKVDVLDECEQKQVENFVSRQLARCWNSSVPIFRYSVKPGFEALRSGLQERLLSQVVVRADVHRTEVLSHKIDSLLTECADYMNLALKSAKAAEFDRSHLREKVLGQKASLDETRLGIQLIGRHVAGGLRSTFEAMLSQEEAPVSERLLTSLDRQFPGWSGSLSLAVQQFEEWLLSATSTEMSELSNRHQAEFIEPVHRVSRQLSQFLSDFRSRLSERTLEALSAPLRTTQTDLCVQSPRSPDVRVGKIFDHSWELLSFLIPMSAFKGLVRRHFRQKVRDAVVRNLSRLTSQWEEIINGTIRTLEIEAIRSMERLIATTERLIASAEETAPQIREDLQQLTQLRVELSQDCNPKSVARWGT
jgi:GTP-binding protein EngB required for normal cell division